MFSVIKPGTNIDFMGKASFFVKLTFASIIASIIFMVVPGIRFGLDFSGGYEMLLAFDTKVTSEQVRAEVKALDLGDLSVQSFVVPDSPKTHFLVRVQRTTVLSQDELDKLSSAFQGRYGALFRGKVGYNPEIGNVVEIPFTASATAGAARTDEATVREVVGLTGLEVNRIRVEGRPDQPTIAVVLRGIDRKVVAALQKTLDPSTAAVKVEYVGPTVGKQLRDDSVMAVLIALIMMLVFIAIRFDFFYAPGAVLNVFHDAILTTGFVIVVQRVIDLDFNLATVASILTLIGYSVNDTIIVYDRIRETVGKAEGTALNELLNRAVNETLARTVMTSATVFFASICLMVFGAGTVLFDFGLIMSFGVVVGTYSSIYVAAPIFKFMRERFADRVTDGAAPRRYGKAVTAGESKSSAKA